MQKEFKNRYMKDDRSKLQDILPLNEPLIVAVEVSDLCNFNCAFCPNGNNKLLKNTSRKLGFMEMDIFKKIIDDISQFDNKLKDLRLYGNGEPLLNPYFPDMVKYAKDANISNRVKVSTNASKLNRELSLKIIEAGLDRIEISIEGFSSEEYKKFSKIELNFDELYENIKFFYKNKKQCEVFIKVCDSNPTEEYKNKFREMFENFADIINIEHVSDAWNGYYNEELNYSSHLSGDKLQANLNKMVCPIILYTAHISSKGELISCFGDFKKNIIFSDLTKNNLKDAWNSKELIDFQKMHLRKERKHHPICKECNYPIYEAIDDIDDYANDILKRYDN